MKHKPKKTEEALTNDVTRILLDKVEPGEPALDDESDDCIVTGGRVDLSRVPNTSRRMKFNKVQIRVCLVSGCGEEIDTDKTVCAKCRKWAEKKLDAMGVTRPFHEGRAKGAIDPAIHHNNHKVFEVLGIKHWEENRMPRTGRSTKMRYGHRDPMHGRRHGGGNV